MPPSEYHQERLSFLMSSIFKQGQTHSPHIVCGYATESWDIAPDKSNPGTVLGESLSHMSICDAWGYTSKKCQTPAVVARVLYASGCRNESMCNGNPITVYKPDPNPSSAYDYEDFRF